jgi:signal transduction histidine kinase
VLTRALRAGRLMRGGLVGALVGSTPPAPWHWRTSWQRRVAYGALVLAVTALAAAIPGAFRPPPAQATQTERAEPDQGRRMVLEERARIARELHDVVAHHMSLIVVRAETAPYRLGELPEPVRAEFESVSAAARDALADMRRVLGVLRRDQPRAGHVIPGYVAPEGEDRVPGAAYPGTRETDAPGRSGA